MSFQSTDKNRSGIMAAFVFEFQGPQPGKGGRSSGCGNGAWMSPEVRIKG